MSAPFAVTTRVERLSRSKARALASSSNLFLPAAADATVAWLFPGQGAQEVGMGRDVYDTSDAAREVFQTADRVLGYSLSEICFEGPEDRLRATEYTQPAIFATSLACLAAAVEAGGVAARPAFTAGHSLGEYSALVAAGAMSLEDGLSLLDTRARLMAEAGRTNTGTLAAVIGMDEDAVRGICADADVDVCNYNLPNQTVVGGTKAHVEHAIELAKERGAQRALELNVSGAFHSRLMRPAAEGLASHVASAKIDAPPVPVVANATATAMTDAAAIRDELRAQVATAVRWHESVTLMAASGVSTFIEFGPGRVLTGMVKRLAPSATLVNVSGLQPV
jgi:[acyl-carrier-protein] S-malonyltransferase